MKKRSLLIGVISLTIILAACQGSNEAASNAIVIEQSLSGQAESSTYYPQEEAAQTSPPNPTSNPTSSPEPTPASEPVPTPDPDPTSAPAPALASEQTPEPTPTPTPEQQTVSTALVETALIVEGMTCNRCVTAVRRAVQTLDGIESVNVNLRAGAVTVVHYESIDADAIITQIINAGFNARLSG